jgi:hypothetical protein
MVQEPSELTKAGHVEGTRYRGAQARRGTQDFWGIDKCEEPRGQDVSAHPRRLHAVVLLGRGAPLQARSAVCAAPKGCRLMKQIRGAGDPKRAAPVMLS